MREPLLWLGASLALALALVPAIVQAQSGPVTIDVVSARSLACSPDAITQPDLLVRVFVNDALVLETVEASDQKEPLFARATTVATPPPLSVGIEVVEVEPPADLFFGPDTFVTCDTLPGEGARFNATYDGGATRTLLARGDGERAAEAVVVVGRDAPAAPDARAMTIRDGSAVIAWTPAAQALGHALHWGGAGPVIARASQGESSVRFEPLCDNTTYVVRVVRESDPWRVASADVEFTTHDAPPLPPSITAADRVNDTVALAWGGVERDVRTIEIHAGAPGFAPGPASLVQSLDLTPGVVSSTGSRSVLVPTSAGEARLVVIDGAKQRAVSGAFSFNAPHRETQAPAECREPLALPSGASPANPTNVPETGGTAPIATTSAPTSASDGESPPAGPLPTWVWIAALAGIVGLVAGFALRARR